jgi:hypothetical protein
MSFTEGLMVRVWTSIDFTIPDAVSFGSKVDGNNVYYLPVAILAKWPPVMKFDLRDASGVSIPLLTSRKNREVDAAVLRAIAPDVPSRSEQPTLDDILALIAEGDRIAAAAAQQALVELLAPYASQMDAASVEGWTHIRQLVSPEVENSLLWVRVSGKLGERQVIKYGYEQPVEQPLFFFRSLLGMLSWREISNVYAVPRVDWAQNYHLQIDAPTGLVLHDAKLVVEAPSGHSPAGHGSTHGRPDAVELIQGLAGVVRRALNEIASLASEAKVASRQRLANLGRMAADPDLGIPTRPHARHFREPRPGEGYAWNDRRRAYLYVSRSTSPFAVAKFSFIAPARSVHAPFAAAVVFAALMTLITATVGAVASHHTDAVTALVVVPALLALFVLRPGEHPLVRRHMAGVRMLLIAAGSAPVLAALALLVHTHPTSGNMLPFLIPLTLWTWGAAGGLALSVLLPARDYART